MDLRKVAVQTAQKVVGLACLAILAVGCSSKKTSESEIRILIWSNYLSPVAVESFEKKTGIKVKFDYFASNEELLAKIQATTKEKGDGYDLILPSDYLVPTMIRLNLIQPIDKSKLSFLADYAPQFQKLPYDREGKYVIPYAWGTTGIAANLKLNPSFKDKTSISWKDFFESPAYKGKVTLLDDVRENVQAALFVAGKKWESATEEDIKEAFKYLQAHKSQIKIWTSEAKTILDSGDCELCHTYSGDALKSKVKNPEIKYYIPEEGGVIWTDNVAIPINASNPEKAYQFMNHFLAAENTVSFTMETFFASPNQKGQTLLSKEWSGNEAIFPPAKIADKLVYLKDRPEFSELIDRLWTELKSL